MSATPYWSMRDRYWLGDVPQPVLHHVRALVAVDVHGLLVLGLAEAQVEEPALDRGEGDGPRLVGLGDGLVQGVGKSRSPLPRRRSSSPVGSHQLVVVREDDLLGAVGAELREVVRDEEGVDPPLEVGRLHVRATLNFSDQKNWHELVLKI